jgi:hypothetical protein
MVDAISVQQTADAMPERDIMSKEQRQWNRTGYPWELELITFCFFLMSMLVPYYFHHYGTPDPSAAIATAGTALDAGRQNLSTQFGFLLSLGIVAIYIFHFAFAFMEVGKITASPLHLLSPCAFAYIAYVRTAGTGKLHDSALSFIDGSTTQALVLVLVVGLIVALLARLRTYRYMLNFDATAWEVISPAAVDASYFRLILQLYPLVYPPRRYLASNEGIMIEGWFYAKPIAFSQVHSLSRINGSTVMNSGYYYASSAHHLVRIEVHDSNKATYISPADRDDFVRYCAQHIARRAPSHRANPTRHGMMHASDTQSGTNRGTARGTSSGHTRPGTRAP